MLQVVYSTPDAGAVASCVARAYPIGPVRDCRLLNRGYNDSFEVVTDDGRRYVARFGGRRLRGADNVGHETAFLAHLAAEGVPVAAPVAAASGALWTMAGLPEGERSVVLFGWIEGHSPRAGSFDDARAQGATLALVHRAGIGFAGPESRFRLDADNLLRKPLAAVHTYPSLAAEHGKALDGIVERLAARLAAGAGELTAVRCHGDCHGGNARIGTGADGTPVATFFDFDDGGPGWLGYDLAVYLWNKVLNPETLELWPAFLEGYRSVAPIPAADLESTRLFVPIRHVWLMGDYAAKASEWGSESLPARWFERQVDFLQDWEGRHLSDALL
jgi:Ser/Thr protein kinase RdoA (MazF antagonist)